MTWGWLKYVFGALGKVAGALFLINHGKQAAEKKELEEDVKAHKKISEIMSTPDIDDPASRL